MNDPESHMALPHPFIRTAPWNPVTLKTEAEQYSPEASRNLLNAKYNLLASLGGAATVTASYASIETMSNGSSEVTGTIVDLLPWAIGAISALGLVASGVAYMRARRQLSQAYGN